MPASPPDVVPAVVLIVPALDGGASREARTHGSPGGPPSRDPFDDPRAGAAHGPAAAFADPSATSPADPLADAIDAGAFTRRPLAPCPWEGRTMAALGLAAAASGASDAAGGAAGSIPAARLLGPDDPTVGATAVAVDLAAAAAAGRLVLADPVSFEPARDEATLTPPEALALDEAEADALIEAANALLAEDGVTLARGASGRWYLAGLDAAALDTAPTHFLARREAGAHLPAADAAAPWRRLMTELQMLWHAHPVNEARLARGAPSVNGVWFWGGAAPPRAAADEASSDLPVVATRNPFAAALSRHAGARVVEADTFDDALAMVSNEVSSDTPTGTADRSTDGRGNESGCGNEGGNGGGNSCGTTAPSGERMLLVVDTGAYAAWLANDAAALERERARIATAWLAPSARAVVDGRAASLVVVGGDGGDAIFEPPARRSWFARLFARSAGR